MASSPPRLAAKQANVVLTTNGGALTRHADGLRRRPRGRVHLRVGVDGIEQARDRVRGAGAMRRLTGQIAFLRDEKIPFTLSTCVVGGNVAQIPGIGRRRIPRSRKRPRGGGRKRVGACRIGGIISRRRRSLTREPIGWMLRCWCAQPAIRQATEEFRWHDVPLRV